VPNLHRDGYFGLRAYLPRERQVSAGRYPRISELPAYTCIRVFDGVTEELNANIAVRYSRVAPQMTETSIKHGNFDSLAGDYSQYRPGYTPSIITAVLSLVGRPAREVDAVDIGAGTGIWTRMLAAQGLRSVTAVEPSDEMRRYGLLSPQEHNIVWRRGTADETGLPSCAYDLATMASSFHWLDFDKACTEFQRILRPPSSVRN
jgi:SAM-dependent methyltransferase